MGWEILYYKRYWPCFFLHNLGPENRHSSYVHQKDPENTQEGTGHCASKNERCKSKLV